MPLSRRRYLKLIGASLALPLLPSALDASTPTSSDQTPPRRLLILYSPNGTVRGEFFPDDSDIQGERQKVRKLLDINQWYAGEIAKLIEQLDDPLDPVANDGSSLFDNTLVVWANNLSDGAKHRTENLPLVTIGDGGGTIDSGQVIHESGRSHQDFLVTLCRAMGLDDFDTFGNPEQCTGPVKKALT